MRNYGQRHCHRCAKPLGGHTPGEVRFGCVSHEDWEQLKAFAEKHGRNWRAKLREIWMLNQDQDASMDWARRLRNTVGPSRLSNVKYYLRTK